MLICIQINYLDEYYVESYVLLNMFNYFNTIRFIGKKKPYKLYRFQMNEKAPRQGYKPRTLAFVTNALPTIISRTNPADTFHSATFLAMASGMLSERVQQNKHLIILTQSCGLIKKSYMLYIFSTERKG